MCNYVIPEEDFLVFIGEVQSCLFACRLLERFVSESAFRQEDFKLAGGALDLLGFRLEALYEQCSGDSWHMEKR